MHSAIRHYTEWEIKGGVGISSSHRIVQFKTNYMYPYVSHQIYELIDYNTIFKI